MKITEYIKDNILFLDGGMGTLLQRSGLKSGELPEKLNIKDSELIASIHQAYFDAGSNVVSTNTFGANSLKFSKDELEEIIAAAVENAKTAKSRSVSKSEKWIALDIGPLGKLLKPLGDLDFEDAVSIFAETVKLGVKYGVDLILIETMNDSYETKAALLAAKENSTLPVFVSNAYDESGKLMTGATPEAMIALLEGMGADAIGVNCSLGPDKLMNVAEKYVKYSSLPVIFKPNAGLPLDVNGETVFSVDAHEFASSVKQAVNLGVSVVGGCCGTTPEYIENIFASLKDAKPQERTKKDFTVVSSYSKAVFLSDKPVLIGERINPTGKPKFKAALKENDIDYILKEAILQGETAAQILDVNVGLPEIDEEKVLKTVIKEIQSVSELPLQIDTSSPVALEKALRIYNGKAMINSVNGKEENMAAVFPIVKKYGGLVIALTLDENGIPNTADGRFKIAQKILKRASEYGIEKKDIIFDPLTLTVSADDFAADVTLSSVKMISEKLNAKTVLGVSNVSFGLPKRDVLNANFFTLALNCGLSAAIMNPFSAEMMKSYYSYCTLKGLDKSCSDYIGFAENLTGEEVYKTSEKPEIESQSEGLENAILKGLKSQSAQITKELLKEQSGLSIIKEKIIPALNTVGDGFQKGKIYLPSLLMSAEAAKAAFTEIKAVMKKGTAQEIGTAVIATVKGDIHDIGKNIVKLLLENYGFAVCDLGKDVPPEKIVDKVIELKAPIVGLSALMTTTVPMMEETVKLLKSKAPWCKTVVGGAVLNREYAQKIGADYYAEDAMQTVKIAQEIIKNK